MSTSLIGFGVGHIFGHSDNLPSAEVRPFWKTLCWQNCFRIELTNAVKEAKQVRCSCTPTQLDVQAKGNAASGNKMGDRGKVINQRDPHACNESDPEARKPEPKGCEFKSLCRQSRLKSSYLSSYKNSQQLLIRRCCGIFTLNKVDLDGLIVLCVYIAGVMDLT